MIRSRRNFLHLGVLSGGISMTGLCSFAASEHGGADPDPSKYLRRVLQIAIHETGHMLGIRHCIAYECCMNGSNNLSESDRAPLFYCPECDPKLWWACKLDPARRAIDLAAIAKRFSFEAEANQWSRIAKTLIPSSQTN